MSGAYTPSSDEKSEATLKLCVKHNCAALSHRHSDSLSALSTASGLRHSPAVAAGVFRCAPPRCVGAPCSDGVAG